MPHQGTSNGYNNISFYGEILKLSQKFHQIQQTVSKTHIPLAIASAKHFIGEKEKPTNKGNDKHEDADFLLHNTSHYMQLCNVCTKFQNPR